MHIAVLYALTLLIPENVGLLVRYGAVTGFVVTTVIAAVYEGIKHTLKKTIERKKLSAG